MRKSIQILFLVFVLIIFSDCCKRKAAKGITITVVDEKTSDPIENVTVSIQDVENSDFGPVADHGTTNSSGEIHLKLSEKCSHHLEIIAGGHPDYFSNEYQEGSCTTRTLPKNITIKLQHH